MGWPRDFNETEGLEAAMRRFRAQGYEATSVHDLAGRMSITGTRLDNDFGDERA